MPMCMPSGEWVCFLPSSSLSLCHLFLISLFNPIHSLKPLIFHHYCGKDNQVCFKPAYDVHNYEELLELLRLFNRQGLGGIRTDILKVSSHTLVNVIQKESAKNVEAREKETQALSSGIDMLITLHPVGVI